MFERRLRNGQSHAVPFLGWREFVPDYVGPFRQETAVCPEISTVIPSMLWQVFPSGKFGEWQPRFRQDVKIEKGVLDYAQ
jgi:CRISPR-associated protein Cas5d